MKVLGLKENQSFDQANEAANKLIHEYRDVYDKLQYIHGELIKNCTPCLKMIMSQGYSKELSFVQYCDSLKELAIKHDLEKTNFCSYLTNHMRWRITDELKKNKRINEHKQSIQVEKYLSHIHGKLLETSVLVDIQELEDDAEQTEMEI